MLHAKGNCLYTSVLSRSANLEWEEFNSQRYQSFKLSSFYDTEKLIVKNSIFNKTERR